ADSVTGLGRAAYLNCPGVPPAMERETEPPGTSAPVAAFTSFTVWVRLLFFSIILPNSVTVKGVPLTVNLKPTQYEALPPPTVVRGVNEVTSGVAETDAASSGLLTAADKTRLWSSLLLA